MVSPLERNIVARASSVVARVIPELESVNVFTLRALLDDATLLRPQNFVPQDPLPAESLLLTGSVVQPMHEDKDTLRRVAETARSRHRHTRVATGVPYVADFGERRRREERIQQRLAEEYVPAHDFNVRKLVFTRMLLPVCHSAFVVDTEAWALLPPSDDDDVLYYGPATRILVAPGLHTVHVQATEMVHTTAEEDTELFQEVRKVELEHAGEVLRSGHTLRRRATATSSLRSPLPTQRRSSLPAMDVLRQVARGSDSGSGSASVGSAHRAIPMSRTATRRARVPVRSVSARIRPPVDHSRRTSRPLAPLRSGSSVSTSSPVHVVTSGGMSVGGTDDGSSLGELFAPPVAGAPAPRSASPALELIAASPLVEADSDAGVLAAVPSVLEPPKTPASAVTAPAAIREAAGGADEVGATASVEGETTPEAAAASGVANGAVLTPIMLANDQRDNAAAAPRALSPVV